MLCVGFIQSLERQEKDWVLQGRNSALRPEQLLLEAAACWPGLQTSALPAPPLSEPLLWMYRAHLSPRCCFRCVCGPDISGWNTSPRSFCDGAYVGLTE